MSLANLYEGWKNHLAPSEFLKDAIETVSENRMSICEGCEYHSKNHKTIRPDAHCTKCGCTLAAKTKCLSCNCPVNKWTAAVTEEQDKEIDNE